MNSGAGTEACTYGDPMPESNSTQQARDWASAVQAYSDSIRHLSVPGSLLDYAREAGAQRSKLLNEAFLPPNLRPLHDRIDASEVFELIRSEGLPLAPIPRAEVALQLIEAGGRIQRREILEQRASDISEDCRAALSEVEDPNYFAQCAFEGIDALGAGFVRSAQALFTVLATTIVDRIDFEGDPAWSAARRVERSMKRELEQVPEVLDDLPGYMFWVAAPMWHAYPSAAFGDGAELPDRWARNASTHAVADVHYNLANCVTAMMFVTALLDLVGVDTEL